MPLCRKCHASYEQEAKHLRDWLFKTYTVYTEDSLAYAIKLAHDTGCSETLEDVQNCVDDIYQIILANYTAEEFVELWNYHFEKYCLKKH